MSFDYTGVHASLFYRTIRVGAIVERTVMHIGFLFNCSIKTNPMVRLSPTVINRVMLIDAVLKQHGSRVFYYSPKHIKSINEPVPGYLIEGNQFVLSSSAIPLVNGNWTYSMRRLLDKGMGYRTFVDWADDESDWYLCAAIVFRTGREQTGYL